MVYTLLLGSTGILLIVSEIFSFVVSSSEDVCFCGRLVLIEWSSSIGSSFRIRGILRFLEVLV
jgi:hypothetical protein